EMKGKAKLPTPDKITHLAQFLNFQRWRVQQWRGPLPAEKKLRRRITWAIRVLTEILPAHRDAHAAIADAVEYHGLDVSKERADLAAYSALITAAAAARKRGLPLVLDPMLVMSKPTPAWTDVVSDVAGLFRRVGAGERAARQMTADVMLDIVGEEIS